jgi:LacI family transcriptional regulator
MKPKIDGVFCSASTDSAVGILYAMRDAGLKVPQDVAIVGYDDMETLKHVRPGLTVVKQPFHEIGKTAVESIVTLLAEGKADSVKTIIFKPTLVARETA